MLSLKQTFTHIRTDIGRRALLEAKQGVLAKFLLLFKRGMLSVILYRISRYFFLRNNHLIPRLLDTVQYFYTRNEVSPRADLGPGLVLGDGGGVGITQVVIAGKNCTFLGCNSITLGAIEGMDISRQRIVIGDHCVLGAGVRVMRAVQLVDGTQVMHGSVVLLPVNKVGSTVAGIPAKRLRIDDYEHIKQWNPLMGGMINGEVLCDKI